MNFTDYFLKNYYYSSATKCMYCDATYYEGNIELFNLYINYNIFIYKKPYININICCDFINCCVIRECMLHNNAQMISCVII